jgi:hypothetical protein
MAYGEVPISFFVDKDMPSAVGQRASVQLDALMSYHFAWMKIKETNPALVEGLMAGNENYTFSWEGYKRDGQSRGVLFAFYRLSE